MVIVEIGLRLSSSRLGGCHDTKFFFVDYFFLSLSYKTYYAYG